MFYKTNAGLGHRQFAFFLKLEENKYLCVQGENTLDVVSIFDPVYEAGQIITDFEKSELEKVEDYNVKMADLHSGLLLFLIENLK